RLEGGGLASAVRADEADDAAGLHGEADTVERVRRAVALRQAARFNYCCHLRPPTASAVSRKMGYWLPARAWPVRRRLRARARPGSVRAAEWSRRPWATRPRGSAVARPS